MVHSNPGRVAQPGDFIFKPYCQPQSGLRIKEIGIAFGTPAFSVFYLFFFLLYIITWWGLMAVYSPTMTTYHLRGPCIVLYLCMTENKERRKSIKAILSSVTKNKEEKGVQVKKEMVSILQPGALVKKPHKKKKSFCQWMHRSIISRAAASS